MRLEPMSIVLLHEDRANVFRIALFFHQIMAEDDVFEHTWVEVQLLGSWWVDARFLIPLHSIALVPVFKYVD